MCHKPNERKPGSRGSTVRSRKLQGGVEVKFDTPPACDARHRGLQVEVAWLKSLPKDLPSVDQELDLRLSGRTRAQREHSAHLDSSLSLGLREVHECSLRDPTIFVDARILE